MDKNKEILKEADSRVMDAIKVFSSIKESLDEAQTSLRMNLSYHFNKLYPEEITTLDSNISEVINEVSELAKKIRLQLKQ